MTIASTHHELDDLGGGRFRHTQHIKRIAHYEGGSLVRDVNDWHDGDATFPHAVLTSSFLAYRQSGAVRICPTRDPQKYLELGRPLVKPAANWQNLPLAAPTRSGNKLVSANANYNVEMVMAGHFVNCWDMEFKGGYVPPNSQLAYRVGLNGLTRQGAVLYDGATPVMRLREPHVKDLANPEDIRPVAYEFVQLNGNTYVLLTLPSLAGIAQPYLDPTLTLQPPDGTQADGLDNVMRSQNPDTNYGTSAWWFVGDSGVGLIIWRGLIRFIPNLPTGAIISATTFSAYCIGQDFATATTMRVYRQLRAWTEAGSTWNSYDGTNNWQAGGGFGALDCEQTAIGSRVVAAAETLNEFKDVSLTGATWAALDNGNGWLVKMDLENNTRLQFASSDSATAAQRPKLVVVYTLPLGAHPVFAGVGQGVFHGVA